MLNRTIQWTVSLMMLAVFPPFFPSEAIETNLYHYSRTNELVVMSDLSGSIPNIITNERNIDRLVGPFPIETNAVWATEYERVAWGYTNVESAWANVLANYKSESWKTITYPNAFFDNVGWVKGTHQAYGSGSAYLWLLQNTIDFQSSTTDVYVSENGITSRIVRVLVGSLGDYCPLTEVSETGPVLSEDFPGVDMSTEAVFRADTRAYYQLELKLNIPCNNGDVDQDGIPDFADGFNWDGSAGNDDDQAQSNQFAPWLLSMPPYLNVTSTWIKFEYSASDPADVTRSGSPGNYTYSPGVNALRVWNKRGKDARDKRSVTNDGNYISSTTFLAKDLGFRPDKKSLDLFIEGVNPAADQMIETTFSTNESDWACLDEVNAGVLKVELELKNSGTIVSSPENEDYDCEKAGAGGTDQLGPLPMGEGRGDFTGEAYTCPIMVIGAVSPSILPAGLEFQWKRLITRRSWFITKGAGGTNWVVTQRTKRGVPNPDDDHGNEACFSDPTPSIGENKIYADDPTALLPADGNGGSLQVGEYIREEKAFIYIVEYKVGGASWSECSRMNVGQIIITKRKAATGNVADDWEGIENSNESRTLDAMVSEAEVRAMVGGALPIFIDSGANN